VPYLRVALLALCTAVSASEAWAIGQERYVETTPSSAASVALVRDGVAATLVLDPADWPDRRLPR
jgi:hypothetical protein